MPEQNLRGALKIFLSFADGAGKTSAMLEDASRLKNNGVDVVVAYLEAILPPETAALARQFEGVPPLPPEKANSPTLGMDLDGVIRRSPRLALVDGLARRNGPGARHPKRWQDVEELLFTGIDVYTTLNIHQLESLSDTVRQQTGVIVEDTVPDTLFDRADELELVDVPPEELLERYRAGGLPASMPAALLEKSNLSILRELAMRRAALRVDDQVRSYQEQSRSGQKPIAGECICVCVSSHPLGERLVRAGRILADSLNADWFVLFVETPGHQLMLPEQRARLQRTFQLAEEMGAQVVTLTSISVPDAVREFTRQQRVTRLVIGRPQRPAWLDFLRGSLGEQLLRQSGSMDVLVVGGAPEGTPPVPGLLAGLRPSLRRYLLAAALAGLASLPGLWLPQVFDPASQVILYLAAVVACGFFLGQGPSVLTGVLSGLAYALITDGTPSRLTLSDTRALVVLAGLLAAGVIVATLAGLLRSQVRATRRREIQSTAINAFSRELAAALEMDEIVEVVVRHVSLIFTREAAVLLPTAGRLQVRAATPGLTMDSAELDVAAWALSHRQPAGFGSGTHPQAGIACLPMETRSGAVGVIVLGMRGESQMLPPEQREMLASVTRLAALAVERALLNEQARQAVVLETTEKLQAALLNSISHDLRTPLSTVEGSLSSLLEAEENGVVLDRETRMDLLENASEEADRLNSIVGDLLDMTRLEAGVMKIRRGLCDLQDVVGTALSRSANRLAGRSVHTLIPDGLPDIPLDFALIVQVLEKMLDNAVKYSLPGAEIDVEVHLQRDEVRIAVLDRGSGVPPADLERIFGKFYRVNRPDGVAGTGLGLSICRGIAEAHGGRIWAENRPSGGAAIILALPLENQEEVMP